MAEEDSDSGSSLVGPGLCGCGQSNKPKKVARRGGQGARGSQGGRGGRGWGRGGEGGRQGRGTRGRVAVDGEHFYNYEVYI